MKKNFLIIGAVLLLGFISCATSQASGKSDWAGSYTGVIPAADAEGINVKIILYSNETYTLEYQYVGKSIDIFSRTGKFSWNVEKNTVILGKETEDDFPKYYKLGRNTLTQLDLAGNIITGELSGNYILYKDR